MNKHNDLVKKYNSFLNLQVGCKYGKVYIIENGKKMIINEKENPCRAFTYATTIQETYLLWTKDFVHSRRELINFNKIYFKLYWHILEKPRNLHKIEKAFIHIYRQEPDPVSIGVIAEILERSKATVHEFAKKDAEDAQFLTSEEVKKLGLKEDLGIENIEKPLS